MGVRVKTSRPRTFAEHERRSGENNMPNEEWIKTLEDGRLVKFTNQTLQDVGAFITAQIEKNEIVYSIVLDDLKNELSRHEVENRFKAELAKR
jgi:hypothetical protein